jgi:hypothetical protein
MTDRDQAARLILQVERDLLARARLRALLTVADDAVASHRQELRYLKARIARRSPEPGHSK